MHLKTFFVVAILGLSHAAVVDQSPRSSDDTFEALDKRGVSCIEGAGGFGHAEDLRACIEDIAIAPSWRRGECRGRRFWLQGIRWDSPRDCITGCLDCLRNAASKGLYDAKCEQSAGWDAWCTMGWEANN